MELFLENDSSKAFGIPVLSANLIHMHRSTVYMKNFEGESFTVFAV